MSINKDNLDRIIKNRAMLSLAEKKIRKDLFSTISKRKKLLRRKLLSLNTKKQIELTIKKEIRGLFRDLYGIIINDAEKIQNIQKNFFTGLINESMRRIYKARQPKLKNVRDVIINFNGTFAHQTTSINTKQLKRVETIVKAGVISGQANNSMVRELMRTFIVPTHQMRTLVRTTITEISSDVANRVYDANKDVIKGYQYVATLDSRTSIICGRLDGKIYDAENTNSPYPPQHYNCRSTTVPIVKSAGELANTKSNRIQKRKLSNISNARRASLDGKATGKTTYSDWLSRQDNSTKLAVLGSNKRVEIFNTGKLKLTQFSDRDGQLVSIEKLEELLSKK